MIKFYETETDPNDPRSHMIALTISQCAERRGHQRTTQPGEATCAFVVGSFSTSVDAVAESLKPEVKSGLVIEYGHDVRDATTVTTWPVGGIQILSPTETGYVLQLWRLVDSFLSVVADAKAFVSYVRDDRHKIDRLCRELASLGVATWTDRNELTPGKRWKIAIGDAIREGSAFIACFSRSYERRRRTYMNEELTVAIEELRMRPRNHAWFLPVSLDGTSPPDLSIGGGESLTDIQSISLADDWDQGVERLARAIRGH